MLARAARRNLQRDAIRRPAPILDQLTLPWLCPAQMRWTTSRTVSGSSSYEIRKQKGSSSTSPRHASRSLATAADAIPSRSDAIPFEGMQAGQSWSHHPTNSSSLSALRPWDPSSPLIIHNSLATAPPKAKFRLGIGGDPAELHQNLHACLRVGRLDRAAAIVQRLTDMYTPSALEVVDAHNGYLRTLLETAPRESVSNYTNQKIMRDLEEWFEKEMVGKAVEADAQTLVILIRASLILLDAAAKEKSVQKYLDLAKNLDISVFEDVMSSPEFSDSELESLIKFQPDTFDNPSTEDIQHDVTMSTPAGRAVAIEKGLITDPSLKVKANLQKGLGLSTLQAALSSFDPSNVAAYPNEVDGTKEEKDQLHKYMRQIQLEEKATDVSIERWKAENEKLEDLGIHSVLQSKSIGALTWRWYSAMLPLVKKELKEVKNVLANPAATNHSDERLIIGPYLEQVTPEKLTALTIQSLLHVFASGSRGDGSAATGIKIANLATHIGSMIEVEALVQSAAKTSPHHMMLKRSRRELLKKLSKGKHKFMSNLPYRRDSLKNFDQLNSQDFPLHVKTRIGALLLDKILRSATITVQREDPKTGEKLSSSQPAWSRSTGYLQGKRVGFLTPHYEVVNKIQRESIVGLETFRLPMLVEPKPWTGYKDGGYYRVIEHVVRQKSADEAQKAYTISAVERGDMDQVLAGLNVLGRTPWRINSAVFKVMLQAWNAGEGVAGLIPAEHNLERPPEPPVGATSEERYKWFKICERIENEKSGLHSQRCYQNFQLEVARAFLNDHFYYPHNLDFRGRAYPIPPTLNHIGADISRGLLKFAKGKELGTVGLQWLKIHLANLYGFDKASLKEREEFAMEHIQEIYDSATNPLTGNRWWASAEDPWQCLACCMELKAALDSHDPSKYVSYIPVHQDGTCNGLQHYAALGGDKAGASQVNLEPSDRPQDIYTGVAELVRSYVAEDAKAGTKHAKFLDGKITRKLVKRTVMTNVYGVTFMGARLQVLSELKEMFPNPEDTPRLGYVAAYVAKAIFRALSNIFNGAQDIQYWLGECAERITTSVTAEQIQKAEKWMEGEQKPYDSKYKNPKKARRIGKPWVTSDDILQLKSSVIWTTPLKMPVVQPYRASKSMSVRTCLQAVSINAPRSADAVAKRKQLQAFPPNFIHSLDATHMILSALQCDEMGLTFASVHDSYWTHAGDIPKLNTILRDCFIRMHSEDIVGRLRAEFEARYAGSMYRLSLHRSSLAGRQVMAWRRSKGFMSPKGQRSVTIEELCMEAERQRLLISEDPEERAKGEAMVTPHSIYQNAKEPSAVVPNVTPVLLGEQSSKRAHMIQGKLIGAELGGHDGQGLPAEIEVEASSLESQEREIDTNTDTEAEEPESVGADATGAVADSDNKALEQKNKAGKSEKQPSYNVYLWVPLTFPPVPQKGEFDVRKLKESTYFFS